MPNIIVEEPTLTILLSIISKDNILPKIEDKIPEKADVRRSRQMRRGEYIF